MLCYKRLDKLLFHEVWLVEVEQHDGFTTDHQLDYHLSMTKRGADKWLREQVFLRSGVKEL